jgi:hypothetical protein
VKKLLAALALTLCAAFSAAQSSPTINVNSAYFGVSLLTLQSATATQTSAAMRLPTFTGYGTLTVTEAGITGSPSGCTLALAYQGNNSPTATAAVSTTAFTPSTGVQTFAISPSVPSGDNYVLTYACSSTYPTAGTITASFSPGGGSSSSDPCQSTGSAKSSVAIAISSATTTQLVALSAGKSVYVCGLNLSVAGTAPAITVEYGTGSACATGTTTLTGAIAPTSGSFLALTALGPITVAPASNALCLLTAGTGSPSFQGVLTYVQQ